MMGMQMDRRTKLMIVVLIAVPAAYLCGPAQAAPPTVTPSPGYDARLQESRKAATTTSDQSSAPVKPPAAPRHRPKRKQAH